MVLVKKYYNFHKISFLLRLLNLAFMNYLLRSMLKINQNNWSNFFIRATFNLAWSSINSGSIRSKVSLGK